MKELIASLLLYIGQNSPLLLEQEIEQNPVQVEIVSKVELVSIAHEGNVPSGFDYDSNSTIGLYNYKNNTIYIGNSVDLETPYGKSILLHELVHYVQYHNDIYDTVNCIQQNESLAYDIQNLYLKEKRVDALFSKQHIFFASLCHDYL